MSDQTQVRVMAPPLRRAEEIRPVPAVRGARQIEVRRPNVAESATRRADDMASGYAFDTIGIHAELSPRIQARLVVGRPGDRYEEEANRAANVVMGSDAPIQIFGMSAELAAPLRRQPLEDEDDEERRSDEDEDEDEQVQARALPGESPSVPQGLDHLMAEAGREAEPLPVAQRGFYEERFGHDFGAVRVHTGPRAATAAAALGAQAFTRGQDVYFGADYYRLDTSAGQWLMAHELAHTLQQRPGVIARQPLAEPAVADETASTDQGANDQRDALVTDLVAALRADPTDRSRRLRDRLATLDVARRRAVLTQVRAQISPVQRIQLDALIAEATEPRSASQSARREVQDGTERPSRRVPVGTAIPELPIPPIPAPATPPAVPVPPAVSARSVTEDTQQVSQASARAAEGTTRRGARAAGRVGELAAESESGTAEAAAEAEQAEGEAAEVGGEDAREGMPRLTDLLEPLPEPTGDPGAGEADQDSALAAAAPTFPAAVPTAFGEAEPSVGGMSNLSPIAEAPGSSTVPEVDGAAVPGIEGGIGPTTAAGLATPAGAAVSASIVAAEETGESAAAEGTEAPVDVQGLIAEISEASAEAEAQLRTAADGVRARVRQRSGALSAAVRSHVERSAGQVRQEFAANRTALSAALGAARGQIDVALAGRLGEIETHGNEARSRIQGVFDEHRTAIEQTVSDNIANAERLRTRYGTLAHDRTAEKARNARQRGEARAGSYPNTSRGRVQADAARGVAERVAREIEAKEPETVQAIEEVVAEIPSKFEEEGQRTLEGYDQPLPELLAEVDNQITAARDELNRAADAARSHLDNIGVELNTELDTAETAAITRVEAMGPRAETQINSATRAAMREINRAVPAAMENITPVAQEATQILGDAEALDRDRSRAFTNSVLAFISGAAEEGTAALHEAGESVSEQLQGADRAAGAALQTAHRQTTTVLNASEEQRNTRLTSFIGRVDEELSTSLAAFNTNITATETRTRDQLQPAVRDLQGQFQNTLRDAETRSGQALDEGMTKNDEALDELNARMSEAASDAAWDHDHPWLAAIRDVGLIIAGVIVGILAVVALVVVVIVAAKVLVAVLVAVGVKAVTAALVAKIALIVVAVAGIGMTAYAAYQGYSARRAQGAGFWEAVGGSVSDVVGITDMRRAFSEEGLSLFDRGFFFGRGAATLVATIIGGRRLVMRFRGRAPTSLPNPRALPRNPLLRTLTRLYNNPAAGGRLLRMRLKGIRPGGGTPAVTPPPVPAPATGNATLRATTTTPAPPPSTPALAAAPASIPAQTTVPPAPLRTPLPQPAPLRLVRQRPVLAGPPTSRGQVSSRRPNAGEGFTREAGGAVVRPDRFRGPSGQQPRPTAPAQVQPRPQVQELPLAASGEGRVFVGGPSGRPQFGVIQGGANRPTIGGRSPLNVRAAGGRGPTAGGGASRGATGGTPGTARGGIGRAGTEGGVEQPTGSTGRAGHGTGGGGRRMRPRLLDERGNPLSGEPVPPRPRGLGEPLIYDPEGNVVARAVGVPPDAPSPRLYSPRGRRLTSARSAGSPVTGRGTTASPSLYDERGRLIGGLAQPPRPVLGPNGLPVRPPTLRPQLRVLDPATGRPFGARIPPGNPERLVGSRGETLGLRPLPRRLVRDPGLRNQLPESGPIGVPPRVQSRINLATDRTPFTPVDQNGNRIAAGWNHVRSRHFSGDNTQSQFILSEAQVRRILVSPRVVNAPIRPIGSGRMTIFERFVEIDQIVGRVRAADGGGITRWLIVYTDMAGNLISTFPVPRP